MSVILTLGKQSIFVTSRPGRLHGIFQAIQGCTERLYQTKQKQPSKYQQRSKEDCNTNYKYSLYTSASLPMPVVAKVLKKPKKTQGWQPPNSTTISPGQSSEKVTCSCADNELLNPQHIWSSLASKYKPIFYWYTYHRFCYSISLLLNISDRLCLFPNQKCSPWLLSILAFPFWNEASLSGSKFSQSVNNEVNRTDCIPTMSTNMSGLKSSIKIVRHNCFLQIVTFY